MHLNFDLTILFLGMHPKGTLANKERKERQDCIFQGYFYCRINYNTKNRKKDPNVHQQGIGQINFDIFIQGSNMQLYRLIRNNLSIYYYRVIPRVYYVIKAR